jgi:hypothetical protein
MTVASEHVDPIDDDSSKAGDHRADMNSPIPAAESSVATGTLSRDESELGYPPPSSPNHSQRLSETLDQTEPDERQELHISSQTSAEVVQETEDQLVSVVYIAETDSY